MKAMSALTVKNHTLWWACGIKLGRAILIGKKHTRTLRGACNRNVVKAMSTLTVKNHTFRWRSGGVRVAFGWHSGVGGPIFGRGLPPVTGGSA